MNQIYRIVWSSLLQAFVVCSELGSRGKKASKTLISTATLAFLLASPAWAAGEYAWQPNGSSLNQFELLNSWNFTEQEIKDYKLETLEWDFSSHPNGSADLLVSTPNNHVNIAGDGIYFHRLKNANIHVKDHTALNMQYGHISLWEPLLLVDSKVNVDATSSLNIQVRSADLDYVETTFNVDNTKSDYNIAGKMSVDMQSSKIYGDPSQGGCFSSDLIDGKYCDLLRVGSVEIGNQINQVTDAPAEFLYKGYHHTNTHKIGFPGEMAGLYVSRLAIGTDGKQGVATLDGGQTHINYTGGRFEGAGLYIGEGAGGNGRVSLLNGGKLATGYGIGSGSIYLNTTATALDKINGSNFTNHFFQANAYDRDWQNYEKRESYFGDLQIGVNGGTGELIVSGGGLNSPSRMHSRQGVVVGMGKDAQGSLRVEKGGEALISGLDGLEYGWANDLTNNKPNIFSQYPDLKLVNPDGTASEFTTKLAAINALRLGVDGGRGNLIIDGFGSFVAIGGADNHEGMVEVDPRDSKRLMGELAVGQSGIGVVTLHNGGKLGIGYTVQNPDYEKQNYREFIAGKVTDANTNQEIDVYGKLVLGMSEDSLGVVNFTGDMYADANSTLSRKASDSLLTSGIYVGRGQGVISFNHDATDANPYIFDLKIAETKDDFYHTDYTKDGKKEAKVGQIGMTTIAGTTLLKEYRCHDFECPELAPSPGGKPFQYHYSGDTNVLGGKLLVEDNNILSERSHFNIGGKNDNIGNGQGGTLDLTRTKEQTIKSLNNDGSLLMGTTHLEPTNPNQHAFDHNLIINGDYSGQGEIVMNTLWNRTGEGAPSSSDHIFIQGDVLPNTHTKIVNRGEFITGNIDLSAEEIRNNTHLFSPALITINPGKQVANDSFYGVSATQHSGHLAKIALKQQNDGSSTVHWTMYVDGDKPILTEDVGLFTQMPYANIEQSMASLGSFFDRNSKIQCEPNQNCQLDSQENWVRQYGSHTENTGDNRFSHRSNLMGMQIGRSLQRKNNQDVGMFIGYSRNNLRFDDAYRTEQGNAIIKDNKRVGTGTTDMVSVGGYYTYLGSNKTYLDLVGDVNYVHNRYQSNGLTQYSQSGYSVGMSAEMGKVLPISHTWQVIPQAQLLYQYQKLQDINNVYSSKETVKGDDGSSVRGRLGVQVQYTPSVNQVFNASANIWHQFNDSGQIQYGNSLFSESFNETWLDVGVGIDHELKPNLNLYGKVSYLHSLNNNHRKSYKGNVGLRWNW